MNFVPLSKVGSCLQKLGRSWWCGERGGSWELLLLCQTRTTVARTHPITLQINSRTCFTLLLPWELNSWLITYSSVFSVSVSASSLLPSSLCDSASSSPAWEYRGVCELLGIAISSHIQSTL